MIAAAIGVAVTDSAIPDLVAGAVIFAVVVATKDADVRHIR